MAVETAETLKRELTDKYVVVADDVPELRRFRGLTGIVKTVNMSGRALVQFDGPADIGWYDIDPTYLNIVDAPLPKVKPAEAHEAPATKPAPEKAAPKKAAGMSPLELARQQGAAGGGAKAQAAPAAGGGKKLSPLELARQQGAAKAGGAKPAGEKPTPATGSSNGEKKLSPLELARQQGAAKPADAAGSETQEPPKPAGGAKLSPLELARQQGAAKRSEGDAGKPELESESVATAVEAPPAPEPPKPAATEDMSGLSKLELARRQGPAKR